MLFPSKHKTRNLTQLYDKNPYTNKKPYKANSPQNRNHIVRLRTDFELGRLVGVAADTQIEWIIGLRVPS